jgi:hypothetical protein
MLAQDLVVPSPKFPPHYQWSPFLGAPPQQRDTLLYFRGDVGAKRRPNYSRGIRQRLHALAQTPEWQRKFTVKIGTREEVPGDYSKGLASSKFCLVAPGGLLRAPTQCGMHGFSVVLLCVAPLGASQGRHCPMSSSSVGPCDLVHFVACQGR